MYLQNLVLTNATNHSRDCYQPVYKTQQTMNDNLKRHKLLQILSEHFIKVETEDISDPIGVSFDDLQSKLNCSKIELRRISSTLYDNKEVDYMDVGVVGMFATEKGLSAYSESKYLRESNLRLKNNIKDLIQIIIPVFSLIIAFLALTHKLEKQNVENEKQLNLINLKVLLQGRKIDNLIESTKKDTLKLKVENKTPASASILLVPQ